MTPPKKTPQEEKPKVIFTTLANWNGEFSLRQHAFINVVDDWGNEGNVSLCGRISASEGNGSLPLAQLPSENLSKMCCKNCLKSFNKLSHERGTNK